MLQLAISLYLIFQHIQNFCFIKVNEGVYNLYAAKIKKFKIITQKTEKF